MLMPLPDRMKVSLAGSDTCVGHDHGRTSLDQRSTHVHGQSSIARPHLVDVGAKRTLKVASSLSVNPHCTSAHLGVLGQAMRESLHSRVSMDVEKVCGELTTRTRQSDAKRRRTKLKASISEIPHISCMLVRVELFHDCKSNSSSCMFIEV